MREYQSFFEENKYLYLPSFLDKENCQQYVQEFHTLINQGHAKKDEQCPLSFSIGHSALFDSLLEQLTPSIEQATGKKLYPTYAYARWYAPGDELKIHKDRPSCEISATITLGFEGNQWPIYMGYDQHKQNTRQINMDVGDAVIYRGQDMYHWREKYVEGQWQAQVFVHYVDAEGPNAEWKYDKRNFLAHHDSKIDSSFFLVKENCFSKESCNHIIKNFENKNEFSQDALLVGNILNKSIRNSKKIQAFHDKGIGATLAGIGLSANQFKWNFNMTHSNQCEYLRYDQNGHFSEHLDTNFDNTVENKTETRKLTVILFLNDDYEGGKLYLKCQKEKIYPKQNQGSVVIFPSFLLHGVEPVISGIRRTIVTWMVGPNFK